MIVLHVGRRAIFEVLKVGKSGAAVGPENQRVRDCGQETSRGLVHA